MSGFHTLMMAGTPVYTVSFDYGDIPAQRVVKNKKAIRPADPYKENYNFTGWFVDGVLFDFNTPVTGNWQLSAGWSLKTYTVTFNANGGDGVVAQTVAYGSTASHVTPSRTYYTFTGWTLNGIAFDFNTPVTADITLVASWEKTLYTHSGTTSVSALAPLGGTWVNTPYGVRVTFPTAFTQVVSGTLNGATIPYVYQSYTSYLYLNTTGFCQVTGERYWKSNSHEGTTETDYRGKTSGNLGWTVTGYYV